MKPGYCDKPEMLLYANFNLLIDFVEKELGWEDKSKASINGVASLIEQMEDDDNQQSTLTGMTRGESAREILELYYWWKNYRLKRISVYDCPKAVEIYKKREKPIDLFINRLKSKEETEMYNTFHIIEDVYRLEDDYMFGRLAKIRTDLWT